MRNVLIALMITALTATFSVASETHGEKEVKEDIARHRVMAQAHENAAKCLEAGKPDAVCEKQLQVECKGLAIGKFCGMKHTH